MLLLVLDSCYTAISNNDDDDDDDDKIITIIITIVARYCHLHLLKHNKNNKKARSSRIQVTITAFAQSVGFPRPLIVCASSFFTYQRTRLKS